MSDKNNQCLQYSKMQVKPPLQNAFEILASEMEFPFYLHFAAVLGVPPTEIALIDRDKLTVKETLFKVFNLVHEKHKHLYNINAFYCALNDIQKCDLAEKIRKISTRDDKNDKDSTHKDSRSPRELSRYVIKRKQEDIVMDQIKYQNKRLIIVSGSKYCGRTTFLNQIHNRIIYEYDTMATIYHLSQFTQPIAVDVITGLHDLLGSSEEYRNLQSLKEIIIKEACQIEKCIIILDMCHPDRSSNTVVPFIEEMLANNDKAIENDNYNICIIATVCICATKALVDQFDTNDYFAEFKLKQFDNEESHRLIQVINPELSNNNLANDLVTISNGYPGQLRILAEMSKQESSPISMLKKLDSINPPRLSNPRKESVGQKYDIHLKFIMEQLNPNERAFLSELLIFPGSFTLDDINRFLCKPDPNMLEKVMKFSDDGYFLFSYDPNKNEFCCSDHVKDELLKIIKSKSIFNNEHLYSIYYCREKKHFIQLHISFLKLLSLHFLEADVGVCKEISEAFVIEEVDCNDTLQLSEKATKYTVNYRSNIILCLKEMVKDLPRYLDELLSILSVSTIMILVMFWNVRRVVGVYKKILDYFKKHREQPEKCNQYELEMAKTKVAIVFSFTFYLGFCWYSDEAIRTFEEAIDVLKNHSEHEMLGLAYFQLGRLQVTKGVAIDDKVLEMDGMRTYKRGYDAWKLWEKESSQPNEIPVMRLAAERQQSSLEFIIGNFELAKYMNNEIVMKKYEAMGMSKHPLYSFAIVFKGMLEFYTKEEGKEKSLENAAYLFKKSIRISEAAIGYASADTIISLKWLGIVYYQQGRYEMAVECLGRLSKIAYYMLGCTGQTSVIYQHLSEAEEKLGNHQAAMKSKLESENIQKEFAAIMNTNMYAVFLSGYSHQGKRKSF